MPLRDKAQRFYPPANRGCPLPLRRAGWRFDLLREVDGLRLRLREKIIRPTQRALKVLQLCGEKLQPAGAPFEPLCRGLHGAILPIGIGAARRRHSCMPRFATCSLPSISCATSPLHWILMGSSRHSRLASFSSNCSS